MQKTQQQSKTMILDKMGHLLEVGWNHGSLARNRDGEACFPEDAEAVSFDLAGAFYRVVYLHKLKSSQVRGTKFALVRALNRVNPHKTLASILREPVVDDDRFRYHLSQFDDAPCRTKMEVLRLVELAKEEMGS